MVEDQRLWERKNAELQNEIDGTKKLNAKMTEDKHLFEACNVELKERVAGLQDELHKTRNLCQKHENLSVQLRKENIELANKVKESNDETKELKAKLTEDGNSRNFSKAELEGTITGLQNELNETRLKHEEFCIQLTEEKKHLEENLKEFDDETKELKEKMTEYSCSWDSCKAELEDTVAGLQNELNATRLKLKEFYNNLRDEAKHMEEKLEGFGYQNKELQNEFKKTKKLCQNLEKKCTVLREQKGRLQKIERMQ